MSTFVNNDVSSGATIFASDHNTQGALISAVLNGGVDDANISPTAAIAGSKLASGGVTNTQLDTSISPVTRDAESTFDFVASGCVWTADAVASTRLASMTAGVVYIGGKRIAISAVTSRTFTASKDVYVDVDNTGTITYTDGTTNAASGALAVNSIRLAIIVVGASSIATSASINQGQEDRVLPIASSIPYAVTDSLGNLICPRDPNRKLLGYRQVITDFSTASTSYVDITGLNFNAIPPAGRKTVASAHVGVGFNGTSGDGGGMNIVDVTAGATLDESQALSAATNGVFNLNPNVTYTPPAGGSRNFKSQFKAITGGTVHTNSSGTIKSWVKLELE